MPAFSITGLEACDGQCVAMLYIRPKKVHDSNLAQWKKFFWRGTAMYSCSTTVLPITLIHLVCATFVPPVAVRGRRPPSWPLCCCHGRGLEQSKTCHFLMGCRFSVP